MPFQYHKTSIYGLEFSCQSSSLLAQLSWSLSYNTCNTEDEIFVPLGLGVLFQSLQASQVAQGDLFHPFKE